LAALTGTVAFVPCALAKTALDGNSTPLPSIDQCLVNQPESANPNQQPINVEANSLEAVNGDKAEYTGNVVVKQGKKQLTADKVTLQQQENVVTAVGNVNFSNGEIKSRSDKATDKLNTGEIVLENSDYEFLCQPGRGKAVYVAKTGKALYQIKDGSITSCPDGDNSWALNATSIYIDQNEEEATFYNPRMNVAGVPVFYLPILTVPIGDTRKTGFLYPSFSYGSSNGYESNIPIYWNLAENYDLQTDIKNMQKRGIQLNSEFRYLNDFGSGSIVSEYLPEDAKYSEYGSRWGSQWTHNAIINNSWLLGVDYSQVSDIDYFSDLSSDIGSQQDGQLVQEGQVSYRSTHWDLTLLTRDFQILSSTDSEPYRLLPQLTYNYYAPELLRYLDFNLASSISNFETDSDDDPAAVRLHAEPSLSVPLATTWGSWTTEARLFSTYYEQDLENVDESLGYTDTASFVIPQFRTNVGLVMERDTTVFNGYTQTIEPRIQYLYVPEKDQSNVAFYDTTLLEADYYGLFRNRKYSGSDYVAPANQISYGATSRFFDDKYKERLNIAFGQILYLERSLTDNENSSYSAWAVEMDFNYDDQIFYHGGVQYDVDSSMTQLANSTIEYRRENDFIQANYRYVTLDYIEDTVGDTLDVDELTVDGISQAGLVGQYSLNRQWSISGEYYYDLTTEQPLEWQTGLTYTSDCWYIGFKYSRELDSWTPSVSDYPDAVSVYENNFGINFGIIGFGTNMKAGVDNSSSSIGYGRPFFLNN
jgi:LPS-assembly protein